MTTTDLADQVAAHMTDHVPDDPDFGGWIVARNTTDHTAAIAWRRGTATLTTPAIRGQMLTRWLGGLHAAGFIGEARTDRSVFADAREPDGYACWLHITDRQPHTA